MDRFAPPKLNLEHACITSKDKPLVGALISNYFNDPGTYFAVLTFPEVEVAYEEENDFRDDGYIARMMGTLAAIRINNAMARLQPTKVFLAGMNDAQKSYIHAYLPAHMIVDVDNPDDVVRRLAFLSKTFDGHLPCKSSEIVYGLLLAMHSNKRLTVDDAAPTLRAAYMHDGKGLVVIENNKTSDEVVAVNYAFSIGADVVLVPPFMRTELHPVQKLIYEWKKQGSQDAYEQLRAKALARVEGINFLKYEFATFFTMGFPYGLVFNNIIPFTHVFIHPSSDIFVLSNIGCELFPAQTDSALIFSPRLFGREETDVIIKMLEQRGYLVRALLGKNASVNALGDYGEHFPFDVMHICSHGGETNGYYVVQEFADRTGKTHKLEYEEIVGFSPAGGGQVSVVRKAIFRNFDGFEWMSEELNKQRLPTYIFEDMRKALSLRASDPATMRRKRIEAPIYSSCHIECSDSIHQGEFHSIACNAHPVVFNNTCSSWNEIAVCFIAAGARGYIGTIWSVNNIVAKEAASVFYEQAAVKGTILEAFYEMIRAIGSQQYRNIYLFWGLHFSTLRSSGKKSDQKIFNILLASFAEWRAKYESTKEPETKRRCLRVLRFLSNELNTHFTAEHLARLKAGLAADSAKDVQSQPDEEPDDPMITRGVVDL